jgi:hypothetical protein
MIYINSDLLKNLNMTVDVVNKVELLGDSPKYFNLQNFKFPNLRKLDILPKPLVRMIGKFLWVKANINSGILY